MDFPPAVRALLERSRVGRLATVDASGAPHVVPVCYALHRGALYSAVDEKPKRGVWLQRLRNLEAEPRAALIVDHYEEDWSRLAWVLVRGTASVLVGGERGERSPLAALRRRYPQYRSMRMEGRPLIRLAPERVSAWGLAPSAR